MKRDRFEGGVFFSGIKRHNNYLDFREIRIDRVRATSHAPWRQANDPSSVEVASGKTGISLYAVEVYANQAHTTL